MNTQLEIYDIITVMVIVCKKKEIRTHTHRHNLYIEQHQIIILLYVFWNNSLFLSEYQD